VDDAYKFVQRDIRRRSSYEGIILDPPVFGHGPKGDVWKLLETLPDLLRSCCRLLSDKPLFLLLTTYGLASSSHSTHNLVEEMVAGFGGCLESGELGLEETSAKRILSLAQFSRWSAT
jgi:23S rRNA (cytosine1962-C5)-methyltransferase